MSDGGLRTVLPDRRAAIVRLLETRDQHLPVDKVRRDGASSGFVHQTTVRESCPDCLAQPASVAPAKGCETCHGRGWLETRRDRDPYAVDKVVQYGLDGSRHDRTYERDSQIDRLAAQTREPFKTAADELADANAKPYGWEIARSRMYRQYDYPALDRGLNMLRHVDEPAYRMLHRVYVYGLLTIDRGGIAESVLERGLVFLDHWLPTVIRAPEPEKPAALPVAKVARTAGDRAFEHRAAEIRRAVLDEGKPTAQVASAWGVTVRQVNRIIQQGEAA